MSQERALAALGGLAKPNLGAFRGNAAVARGVSRKQLFGLADAGLINPYLPDTYLVAWHPSTPEQKLRAALLWGGEGSAAAGRSAGNQYGLDGVGRVAVPEIVVPRARRLRNELVDVQHCDLAPFMIRTIGGVRSTGIEATLVRLAAILDGLDFELSCEDARRRRLTTIPALARYLELHARKGRRGVGAMRDLLAELDPVHPSRSGLEVMTRRLLVAEGITGFVREMPLAWNGHRYFFDFGFPGGHTILETNGRRWHDDPKDYEHDNEKWSVPGRHGYKLVFATWDKVTRHPEQLLHELRCVLAA